MTRRSIDLRNATLNVARAERYKLGVTATEVASKLGMSPSTICAVERGLSVRVSTLNKIGEFYGIPGLELYKPAKVDSVNGAIEPPKRATSEPSPAQIDQDSLKEFVAGVAAFSKWCEKMARKIGDDRRREIRQAFPWVNGVNDEYRAGR